MIRHRGRVEVVRRRVVGRHGVEWVSELLRQVEGVVGGVAEAELLLLLLLLLLVLLVLLVLVLVLDATELLG